MEGSQKLRVFETVADRHPPMQFATPFRMLFERRNRFDRYIREGNTVVDIGAGSGYYSLHIARILGNTGTVYAVDSSEKMIRLLERKAASQGLTNLKCIVSSASRLDSIKDGTADFVISNLTLCCMTQHSAAMDEMLRIMKPGSLAYFSVTALHRRSDPRGVSAEEFARLISRFDVIESSSRGLVRWALLRVSHPNGNLDADRS